MWRFTNLIAVYDNELHYFLLRLLSYSSNLAFFDIYLISYGDESKLSQIKKSHPLWNENFSVMLNKINVS